MVVKRHIKANNKYLKDYDSKKLSIFIPYLDANNLYGWAMMKKLPTHDFKWMNGKEIKNWNNLGSSRGCILEVDLDYPKELHDLHNDFSLALEKIKIELGENISTEKLVPNLYHKKTYGVHHEILKKYLEMGLVLRKIHKGISFEESPWSRPYVEKNTNLRTLARNKFEKDVFKLMNNSVFEKTMENIRNRVDIELVNSKEGREKIVKKPFFKSFTIFDNNFSAVHKNKTKLILNKPIYVGMAFLDISKSLMYNFHYDYIKKKYGDEARLGFTDTDSLLYEIETEDFYKDISPVLNRYFDTFEIITNNPYITKGSNKKTPGVF